MLVYLLMAVILEAEGLPGWDDDRYVLCRCLCCCFAVAFPFFGEKYYVDLVMKIMILSVFALSLELLVGQTGLVSFGHAAFFGIGAYVAALLSPQSGPASFWLLFPAALGAAGLYALAVGALSLRTRGIYFIMVTLARRWRTTCFTTPRSAVAAMESICTFVLKSR